MTEERPLMIGLVRVSTDKQAASGLGLAGQVKDIEGLRQDERGVTRNISRSRVRKT